LFEFAIALGDSRLRNIPACGIPPPVINDLLRPAAAHGA
jgi:hypothetical protein